MNTLSRGQHGFTLLELIIVVSLVIIFFSVAAMRLLPLRGDAEAARIIQTVGSLRSALGMQMSERALNGDVKFVSLAQENPFEWLRLAPPQESGKKPCFSVSAGNWQWCEDEHVLIYRLRYPQYYEKNAFRDEFLRFRTEIQESAGMTRQVRLVALDGLPELKEDTIWPL